MRMRTILGRLAAGAAALTLAASVSGCGNKAQESNGTIAVICKAQGVQFWEYAQKGAEDGGEEMMYDIYYDAPVNETVDDQAVIILNAIDMGVDAIVLAQVDTDKLNDKLEAADSAGIPVITIDSSVSYEGVKSIISSQNTSAGSIAGRKANDLLGGSGKIAIVGHVEGAQTTIERESGFISAIDAVPGADYKFVETVYCNNEADIAKEQTLMLIEQNPDISLIYGTNESASIGVCQAVSEKGLSGQIKVIGFDSAEAEVNFIKDGTLNGMIVQNPYNMGYLGVRNAMKVLNGQTVAKSIDTGVTFVDKDNIDEEYVQHLLYPEN